MRCVTHFVISIYTYYDGTETQRETLSSRSVLTVRLVVLSFLFPVRP